MLSDTHVRYLLVPVVAFVAQASDTGYLADFWHHLARGEVMLETGRILNEDRFTFTVAGQPLQDVNWLAQVLYAWLFGIGGLGLVRVANALVLALTMGLLVHLCRRHCGSLILAMAVSLGVFLGLWQVLTVRPQSFSLLLFVLFLIFLLQSRNNPSWLIPIPFLQGLWTNLHGAFPAGLFLIGCFGLAELIRAVVLKRWTARLTWLSLTMAFSLLAILANPYGWHIVEYVGLTSQRASTRGIDEWLPPSLDQSIGLAFFLSLPVMAAALLLAWKNRRFLPTLEETILVMFFLPLAALSIRMAAWWLLILTLPLSRSLAALFPSARDESPSPTLGAILTVGGLLLFAVFSLPGLAERNPLFAWRQRDPTQEGLEGAYQFLEQNQTEGRVFARLEWGEYLGWRGHPRFPVFMDGRIEIIPDEVWSAYSQITRGEAGWETALEKYGATVLVLDQDYHGRLGLLTAAETSANWTKVQETGPAIVFLRK